MSGLARAPEQFSGAGSNYVRAAVGTGVTAKVIGQAGDSALLLLLLVVVQCGCCYWCWSSATALGDDAAAWYHL